MSKPNAAARCRLPLLLGGFNSRGRGHPAAKPDLFFTHFPTFAWQQSTFAVFCSTGRLPIDLLSNLCVPHYWLGKAIFVKTFLAFERDNLCTLSMKITLAITSQPYNVMPDLHTLREPAFILLHHRCFCANYLIFNSNLTPVAWFWNILATYNQYFFFLSSLNENTWRQ